MYGHPVDLIFHPAEQSFWDQHTGTIIAAVAVLFSVFTYWRTSILNKEILKETRCFNKETLNITKEHNRLSVLPILDLYTDASNPSGGKLIIKIVNDGVGPLIIIKTEFKYQGLPFQYIDDLLDHFIEIPCFDDNLSYNRHIGKLAIKDDGFHELIEYNINDKIVYQNVINILKKVQATIDYTDIYNNKFQYKSMIVE